MLGLSYGEFEDNFIDLLSRIEKRRSVSGVNSLRKCLISPRERRRRELKKLEFAINYEGREGNGESSVGKRKGRNLELIAL